MNAARREHGMELLEEAMAAATAGRVRNVHTLAEHLEVARVMLACDLHGPACIDCPSQPARRAVPERLHLAFTALSTAAWPPTNPEGINLGDTLFAQSSTR